MYKSLLTFSCLAASCAAFAQLSSIGEFTGDSSEGFESFDNYNINGGGNNQLSVFGGGASLNSNPAATEQVWVYEPLAGVAWNLGGNGFAVTKSGTKAGGFNDGGNVIDVSLVFTQNALRFGGYFATVVGETTTVRFFDSADNQIGSDQQILTGSNAMTWFGWESTTEIASIRFQGGQAPVMDDLQMDAVPEPATMALAGAAGLAWLRRRKKST